MPALDTYVQIWPKRCTAVVAGPVPKLCADSWVLKRAAKHHDVATDDLTDAEIAAKLNAKCFRPVRKVSSAQ